MAEKTSNTEKNFLIQGSILAIAGVITRVIGAVYRIPLVNILGDTGMGYYGVAFQIYSIALTLTSYSLPLAVSKLVSARLAKKEYKNANRIFRGALTFAIVVAGIVAMIVFFGADFIATNIMAMSFSSIALRVLAPCILIVALLGVLRGFFQGNDTMIPTAVSQVIEQIINAVVSIVGAYTLIRVGAGLARSTGEGAYEYAYAAAGGTLGTVIGALAGLAFLIFLFILFRRGFRRKMRHDRDTHAESYGQVYKVLLATIAPILLSATVYNLCGVLDNALFGQIMSMQGFAESEYAPLLGILSGKYDVLVNVPLAFSSALAASLMPNIVSVVQTGTKKEVYRRIDTFNRFDMVISIPCAVGLIVLAKPILDLLFYTENNSLGAVLLEIGAISVIFYNLSTVSNAVLQGMDDMMTPVISAAIAMGIHVVVLVILMVVFHGGIYAVVVSKIVFAASASLLNAWALHRKTGYVQEMRRTFAIPAIAAAIMGVITVGVYFFLSLFIPTRLATVIAILIAVVVYAVAIVLLGGISEEEMLGFPRGATLVRICKKLHLLKG